MNQNISTGLGSTVIILVAIIIAGTFYFFGQKEDFFSSTVPIDPGKNKIQACTEEAKICPDGSAVVRSGPNCEFAPCPEEVKNSICQNVCGNGTCQEIVCMGTGCPCPETVKSCPQDCALSDSLVYKNTEYGFQVTLPEGWEKYNSARRMGWLANEKVSRRNMNLIDQWNWWRAHKVSKIIRRITTEVKLKKPLWLFTLTWEKGWQHGQDPIMFADAGADIDALMLYEANREQFDMLLDEWHNYIKKGEANLVLGDVVDWPLHQNIMNPPGPEEFYNRLIQATKRIYNNSNADAIFIHDLARALWGRIKPYSTEEWMISGAAAISEMRRLNGILPLTAEINLDSKLNVGNEFIIPVEIKNISNEKYKNVSVKLHLIGGTVLGDNKKYIEELKPNQATSVSFRGIVKTPSWEKDLKNMIAVQVFYEKKNATFFKYVTVR